MIDVIEVNKWQSHLIVLMKYKCLKKQPDLSLQ